MNDARTTDHKEFAERIDTLETRLTFQDETIEALNQTITAQWQQIDRLTRQLAQIQEQLQRDEANTDGDNNERPPHY